jgi:hypothetical protein
MMQRRAVFASGHSAISQCWNPRLSPPWLLCPSAPLPWLSIQFHGRKTGAEGRFQSAQQVRPCDVSDAPFGFFCSTLNTIRAFNNDGPVVVTLYKAAKTTRSSKRSDDFG